MKYITGDLGGYEEPQIRQLLLDFEKAQDILHRQIDSVRARIHLTNGPEKIMPLLATQAAFEALRDSLRLDDTTKVQKVITEYGPES